VTQGGSQKLWCIRTSGSWPRAPGGAPYHSLSPTASHRGSQQAPTGTSGMVPWVPIQAPVQRTCQQCGQHMQTGPCGRLPIHRGLQLQEEPMSVHRSTVFKELSDRLGAFGCRGGKRRATYAEQSKKQKGLCYSWAELCWSSPCTWLLPKPWVPEF
jgi:hypothetical protein